MVSLVAKAGGAAEIHGASRPKAVAVADRKKVAAAFAADVAVRAVEVAHAVASLVA